MALERKVDDGSYNAEDIVELEGLEAVRLRPGMYVGGTDQRSLHHIIWEVVDNSIDEALAGYCDKIEVRLIDGNIIEVIDNGRGIPPQKTAKGKSALVTVFTVLHAGGKFATDGGYKVSGGLHGVGASVTNALSEWLEVEVRRDGYVWTAGWKAGKDWKDLKQGRKLKKGEQSGTTVRFKYDSTIFNKTAHYSAAEIEQVLQQKSYLVQGLTLTFQVDNEPKQTFFSKVGLADYVQTLTEEREPLHKKPLSFLGEATVKDPNDQDTSIAVEAALQWTKKTGAAEGNVLSFANIVVTPSGGAHMTGFKAALTRALNRYALETGKFKEGKKNDRFESRDVLAALTGMVSVKLSNPQFEGQTKEKLNNAEARTAVQQIVYQQFTDWLADSRNNKDAKIILDRCLHSWRARMAEGSIKNYDPNSMSADNGQSEKLNECQLTTPVEERELFLVEGDSAGGTAVNARDNAFQAILPLKGKIINAISKPNKKVFENDEILAIVQALGGKKDYFEGEYKVSLPREKRRYGKIVIAADADQDGAHITNLILVMFHELFPDILREGRVFIANPPLFQIKMDTRGEKREFAWTDEQRAKIVAKAKGTPTVQRFKGLGEMNADELANSVMLPEFRSIQQVHIDDAAELVDTLRLVMGGSQTALVQRRRQWLSDENQRKMIEL